MENIGFEIVAHLYNNMKVDSFTNRLNIMQKFGAFYRKDKYNIDKYIRDELRGCYSKETIEGGKDKDGNIIPPLRIRHKDKIHKIIRNQIAGIFDDEPTRELYISDNEVDEGLAAVLEEGRYSKKVKDAVKKAKFFNVALVQPVIRDDKLEYDVYTPDFVQVDTKPDDYLKIERIFIAQWDNEKEEMLGIVWTDNDHYLIDASGKIIREENGKKLSNIYGRIPFAVLRIEDDGIDFWGEPNWNLLDSQIAYDCKLTDMDYTQSLQMNGIWIGLNLQLKDGDRIAPNTIINNQQTDPSLPSPDLKNVAPSTDFESIRDGLDYEWDSTMSSEGMNAGTIQQETKLQSGTSKAYDEVESQIVRDDLISTIYDFELDLLELTRIVWNAEKTPKLNESGTFEVTYSEEKPAETVQDKKTRREMEKANGTKSEIDFTMEDLEISREDAIKVVAMNLGFDENITEKELLVQLRKQNKPLSTFLTKLNEPK